VTDGQAEPLLAKARSNARTKILVVSVFMLITLFNLTKTDRPNWRCIAAEAASSSPTSRSRL